jgi:RNA polymerase sigma-70 factor (sigma-E family)
VDARPSTFEEFYRRTWPVVFRSAYLIAGDREAANDLAQEAFARAFERWKSVSTIERPEAWMQRVVANLALSWRRRQRLARDRTPSIGNEGRSSSEEAVPLIVAALRAVPPSQRAVVVLRFYVDLSIEETARALGKRPSTVRSLSAQGIARLREQLGSEEVRDG